MFSKSWVKQPVKEIIKHNLKIGIYLEYKEFFCRNRKYGVELYMSIDGFCYYIGTTYSHHISFCSSKCSFLEMYFNSNKKLYDTTKYEVQTLYKKGGIYLNENNIQLYYDIDYDIDVLYFIDTQVCVMLNDENFFKESHFWSLIKEAERNLL